MIDVDELTSLIYERPLSELRDSERFRDPTDPVVAFMLVIDFASEVEMNGIANFISNSTGRYAEETVTALNVIDEPAAASVLRGILDAAARAGMTHSAMQADMEALEIRTVASHGLMQGNKWDGALEEIEAACQTIDIEAVRRRALQFAKAHEVAFEQVIAPTATSKAEIEAARNVRTALHGLSLGSTVRDSAALRDLCAALQRVVPDTLARQYRWWDNEALDGIEPLLVRKTSQFGLELLGIAILLADQTLAPLRLRLGVLADEDKFKWIHCYLGQVGNGAGDLQRVPYSRLKTELTTLKRRAEAIDWKYCVLRGWPAEDG